MFLPAEVMISSFLRSTIAKKPSSSSVPMSPVCTQPSASMSVAGGLLLAVVAGGDDRAADEDLAVLAELDLHAGHGPADRAEPEAVGAVGGDRAAGLGHAVDVVDGDAEAGEEPGDLDRHRRGRGAGPRHPVEAEQQPEEAEDRRVGLVVASLELGRHGAAVLLRPAPTRGPRPSLPRPASLRRVGVRRELRRSGLDLLPDARDAEERRRLHLAERGQQLRGVGDSVDVAARICGHVQAEHPLGDVGQRQVADLRWGSARPAPSTCTASYSTLWWVSTTPLGFPVVPDV